MARARKGLTTKPRKNKNNQAKTLKLIKRNQEILNILKK